MQVVLYTILTGTLPFQATTFEGTSELVRKGIFHMPSFLSRDVARLIKAILVQDRQGRAKLSDVQFDTWLAPEPVTSPPIPPRTHLTPERVAVSSQKRVPRSPWSPTSARRMILPPSPERPPRGYTDAGGGWSSPDSCRVAVSTTVSSTTTGGAAPQRPANGNRLSKITTVAPKTPAHDGSRKLVTPPRGRLHRMSECTPERNAVGSDTPSSSPQFRSESYQTPERAAGLPKSEQLPTSAGSSPVRTVIGAAAGAATQLLLGAARVFWTPQPSPTPSPNRLPDSYPWALHHQNDGKGAESTSSRSATEEVLAAAVLAATTIPKEKARSQKLRPMFKCQECNGDHLAWWDFQKRQPGVCSKCSQTEEYLRPEPLTEVTGLLL